MEGDAIIDWPVPDENLKREFPVMCALQNTTRNFYVAVGYALLTQLSRVMVDMRKEVFSQIRKYFTEGVSQTTNPALNAQVVDFLPLLEESTRPDAAPYNISELLRTKSNVIGAAFQIILAAIFRASHKEPEAKGILEGEDVFPGNKYYFTNLTKSLYICVGLYIVDEETVEYVEDSRDSSIMINIYVPSKNPIMYAALKHEKEIELEKTGDKRFVDDYPFLKKKKGSGFKPKDKVPSVQNNPIPQANPTQNLPNPQSNGRNTSSGIASSSTQSGSNPAQGMYNNPAPNNQVGNNLPATYPVSAISGNPYQAQIPPIIKVPSQGANPEAGRVHVEPSQPKNEPSPKKSDPNVENIEEVLIEKLVKIFNEDDLMLTRSEAKELKKLFKVAKKENSKINTQEFKNFIESSKNCCKKDHDQSRFVVFKTCGKRHCIDCLGKAGAAEIICDCRLRLKQNDLEFRFGLASEIECFVCGRNADPNNSILGKNGRYIHKECF